MELTLQLPHQVMKVDFVLLLKSSTWPQQSTIHPKILFSIPVIVTSSGHMLGYEHLSLRALSEQTFDRFKMS